MANIVDITVPDIGDFTDVPVIAILVKAGEAITKEMPLVELESEKATMEVPAPFAGTITEIVTKVGDKVSRGTVLARAEVAETAAAAQAPTAPAPAPTPPAPQPAATASVTSPVTAPAASPVAPAHLPATSPAASNNGSTGAPTHASPAIRKFARELGVELGGVHGSGPNGRITREDVQGFVKRSLTSGATNGSGATLGGLALAPWPRIDFAKFGPIERVPLSRIKKISGPNLARTWVMIPHVTQHDDADVTDLEAFRKQINAERSNVKLTMLAFLMKAAVAALKNFPDFNSSLDGDDLVRKSYYHLGFAADTPGGLVVPVVRDVDTKGVIEIARETGALAAKARDGKLTLAEMSGSTFTISSLGGIGGTAFTPIINAPEVAILGVSRTAIKPVWDGTAFAPRTMLPLSLSYDHRVIDGAAAARFCVYLGTILSDMRRTLL
jgi:pyruvate dehydrogenase E2 component (dihydrolipoamide acetyltransferase)